MAASYKKTELEIFRTAVRLEEIIKKEKSKKTSSWLDTLRKIEEQIQERKFRVAIVGEFKRGKSSIVNVLLGKRILPENVLPTTATINRITYGKTPKAFLVMKGKEKKKREVPLNTLEEYITKLTEASAKKAAQIEEAVIEYPTMLCYHDVDLIDTPGMNDAEDMNAVTISRLEGIDLAIVAIHASYPFSETEQKFVIQLLESQQICQIVFVVTYIDLVRPREKEKILHYLKERIPQKVLEGLHEKYLKKDDRIYEKYHIIFDNLHVYGVSSLQAMDALETNDNELYQKSGFFSLNQDLSEIILSSRSVNMLTNMLKSLDAVIKEYNQELGKGQEAWEIWRRIKVNGTIDLPKMMKTMNAVSNRRFLAENFNKLVEKQKNDTTKNLLQSLGKITEDKPEAVNQAMLPAIQKMFKVNNEVLYRRRQELLKKTIMLDWMPILHKFIADMGSFSKRYPVLQSVIQTENKKLSDWLSSAIYQSFKQAASAFNSKENVFFWSKSPVQAVSELKEGYSVLPIFQQIVNESIDKACENLAKKLSGDVAKKISIVNRQLKRYITSIDEWVKENERINVHRESEVEIKSLQKKCDNLQSDLVADTYIGMRRNIEI